jgi:hypothetical protein
VALGPTQNNGVIFAKESLDGPGLRERLQRGAEKYVRKA